MAPLLPGGTPVESLLRGTQFSTPGYPTPDYHGVNCTGSCSWKVYVIDGVIIWETQQTDYPSVGPDSPEYEPRGLPTGYLVLVHSAAGRTQVAQDRCPVLT